MAFNTGAALLDALVLSVAGRESTYGYKITQDVRGVMHISESTLYPVLRRLQKDGYLTTFDREHAGRNRRYYQITDAGPPPAGGVPHGVGRVLPPGGQPFVRGGRSMTRQEFLRALEQDLADVSAEERAEAVRFYGEYFDEAGPECEQALLEELGDAHRVANIIRANMGVAGHRGRGRG